MGYSRCAAPSVLFAGPLPTMPGLAAQSGGEKLACLSLGFLNGQQKALFLQPTSPAGSSCFYSQHNYILVHHLMHSRESSYHKLGFVFGHKAKISGQKAAGHVLPLCIVLLLLFLCLVLLVVSVLLHLPAPNACLHLPISLTDVCRNIGGLASHICRAHIGLCSFHAFVLRPLLPSLHEVRSLVGSDLACLALLVQRTVHVHRTRVESLRHCTEKSHRDRPVYYGLEFV